MGFKEFGFMFNKFTVRITLVNPGDTIVHYGFSFSLNDFAGYTYWENDPAGRLCIGIVFNRKEITPEVIVHECWHLIFRMIQAFRENPTAETLGSEIWAYTFEGLFRDVRNAIGEISKEENNG